MIRGIFEAPGNERLLTFFGKRLGSLLDDQAGAQEIVAQWLARHASFLTLPSLMRTD